MSTSLDANDLLFESTINSRSESPATRVETPPTPVEDSAVEDGAQKKKKKKKPKKSAAAKARDAEATKDSTSKQDDLTRQSILSISRNKHWRYISSYHGPWLQLPVELLESLLTLNVDPATLAPPRLPPNWAASSDPLITNPLRIGPPRQSPPDSPRSTPTTVSFPTNIPPNLSFPDPGKPAPPPIDPGVFRNVTAIRRLIDEAAELSVRASSGLSAAELSSMRSSSSIGSSYLGFNAWGTNNNNGRNVAMSAMRIHRLRALAVQKLAAAYRADEIASSVMVMQGGTVFDDLAERVLKVDPNDPDARYVHFFHEKIPSRQLAEFTTTQVLDELIQRQPQKLEYYRTRGIVHSFRDEFSLATKDFTHALKEARAIRKAKVSHHHNYSAPTQNGKANGAKGSKKRKGGSKSKVQPVPDEETGDAGGEGESDDALLPHPSVLPDAPTPLEPQLLFLRGATYLQQAIHIIESAILKLEGVYKFPATSPGGSSVNGVDLRLSLLEGSVYGGVEIGNPEGPLGCSSGKKVQAYREIFGVAENGEWNTVNGEREKTRDQIIGLVRKSIRDHERFLAHFDSINAVAQLQFGIDKTIVEKVEYAFKVAEAVRPGTQTPPTPLSQQGQLPYSESDYELPTTFTTYHPLLVEAHFSILLCYLLLGDFTTMLPTFVNTAKIIDGLEGYPVFLPPRSLAQAEFLEVLDRLAASWKTGIAAYSVPESPPKQKEKGKARVEEILEVPESIEKELADAFAESRRSTLESDDLPTASASSSTTSTSPSATRSATPAPPSPYAQALNSVRILLAPVAARQREKESEKSRPKKGAAKMTGINIPLHGPRVDIILAWLGAVHIPALEKAAV
ncbi:CRAL-TRIO-N domain-containing protein [Mycena indigotica]|uniref:CRAL-TRIO-N domain-containing protein n=1 Tax=Mycena indigotica TaxID=2126181 RepID=A0A8H6T9G6_9AGAR|nr:CRAL-TRIO-N domain-containing protein [Mycena indigotica]KAF7312387.1 CRAL-TRIO-N domain-containing protein [Mycena indigotica]